MKESKSACFKYIDTDEEVSNFACELRDCSWAGVDIEGSSLHSFSDNVALIQISTNKGIYIVDPLCGIDITPFLNALSEVELIFHGGDYDLRMLLADFGFEPRKKVYDTMIGAELLGIDSVGLAAVLTEFFNIELSKDSQKSDWTKRPLSDTQLKYACADVLHLRELCDEILIRLDKLGRVDWWRQSCERLVFNSRQIKDDDKDLWRIKGSRDFDASQLRYLKFLWLWRNSIAEHADKPVFKVASNSFLLNISVWLEKNPGKNPKRFIGLPKNCRGKNFDLLMSYIKQARVLPKEQFPQPLTRVYRRYERVDKDLVEQLKECANTKAQELNLKPQIIITRARLELIARLRPKNKQQLTSAADLMEWQGDIVASDMLKILDKYSREQSK